MYIGHMVQGRHRVVSYKIHEQVLVPESEWIVKENTHEPIVSVADFEKAQDLLKRDTRTPNNTKAVHMFSGFLRCLDCDKAMARYSSKGITYYLCHTYTGKSKAHCTKHTIREDLLTKLVLEAIRRQIHAIEDLATLVDEHNGNPDVRRKTSTSKEALEKSTTDRTRLRDRLTDIYVDWKSGAASKDQYLHMKDKFEGQIERLSQVIEVLEKDIEHFDSGVISSDPIFEAFLANRNITSFDRGILVELVDTIYVHEDKQITIRFKFADELERALEYVEEAGADETEASAG
jgi:nitrogen regulatory protein PII-like uncharacterized protein